MKTSGKALLASAITAMLAMPAIAAEKLNIYAWSESIDPALIEQFEKETGIEVTLDSYTSNEALLAKLKSGATDYDLAFPSQHFVKILIQEGLLENIEANKMPAFANTEDKWKNMWWDPTSEYSIPFVYGTAGFTVNSDLYKGPADSWKEFFEPSSELKGKVAVFESPDEIIPAAQLYLGIDYCSEDSKEMKRVYDLLAKQKKSVAVYSSDNISSRVASGEVIMHSWWDGTSMMARKNDKAPVKYAQPKEGLVGWLDSMVVPKGASNINNAKTFINWMTTKDVATQEFNFYGHPPTSFINEELAEHKPGNSPEVFPSVPVKFTEACSPAAQALVDKVWTQLLR
ncbi:extracellular solute-binding protein [Pseudomaricurvus sp. HS19]|uniref:extracellular solute-binding protein n=1 Tax=Pseudomaricurvus sp. HS19 TaxID=2692626 RepID=UPI001370174B|nr:extracellular solute-binding protein [Pseudomaricurvus sp. HS19]MYM61811.1 extracellular solute-binding protein [Pseudomaricurvus sp. HS19]